MKKHNPQRGPRAKPEPKRAPTAGVAQQPLAFPSEEQARSNWCWSAVACGTARFYDKGSAWTQCKLAGALLGRTGCCGAGPAAEACDLPGELQAALVKVGHLQSWDAGYAGKADLAKELGAGRVVGVRIGWRGGGGHFVIVRGFDQKSGTVWVADPAAGPQRLAYEALRGSYRGLGKWTHTFWTRSVKP